MYILQSELREHLIRVNFDWSLFVTFLTSIINSWPLAVILIFLMLRTPLINLIKSIGSVEFKDGKFSAIINYEIKKELSEIEESNIDSKEIKSDEDVKSQFGEPDKNNYGTYNYIESCNNENIHSKIYFGSTKKENIYLIGLVASLHRDLEKLLHEYYVFALNKSNPSISLDLDSTKRLPITQHLNFLYKQGIIDNALYNKTRNIITIRNKIIHNISILSNDTLSEYIIQTQLIIDELSKIYYLNQKRFERKS